MKKIIFYSTCIACLLLAGCSKSSDEDIIVSEPVSPENLSAKYYVAESGTVESELVQTTQTENQVVIDEVSSLSDQGVIAPIKD